MVMQFDMEMDDDAVKKTYRGCSWSVFRALNYRFWKNNVKKILPYRKHHLPKYSKGTGTRNARLQIAYDYEERHTPVISYTRKANSTNKSSLSTHIKSLISKEPLKKESFKQKAWGSLTRSRSEQTNLTHHLQSSDYLPLTRTQSYSGREPFTESYEAEDVLKMYRLNQDLFSKVVKCTDGGIEKSFCNLETHEARAKLTRSYSYPSPKLSNMFEFCKLDHKQNEIWSHLKNDKLFANRPQVVDGRPKYSRAPSSNMSHFEKYVQLLPKSSMGETSSKSLKLTNECSFKRSRSLSRFDSYVVFQNESSCYGHSEVLVKKADLDSNRNIEHDCRSNEDMKRGEDNEDIKVSSHLLDCINEHETTEVSDTSELTEDHLVIKDSKNDKEVDFFEVLEEKLPLTSCSFLAIQSNFEEEVTSLTGFLASKDFERENSSSDIESQVESEHIYCSKSRSSTSTKKTFEDIVDDIEFRMKSYSDFDYVSDILDRAGFRKNDLLAPWYSSDQPLNPWLFDEVEGCWPHEDVYSKDEVCCHHQLLFDLINEVLVHIYDISFTYYPRALSSNCRIPPMPAKFDVLDEVWEKVRKIMTLELGSDPTAEATVGLDIWSDDRWMNLQLESECVALELEDMLFDELLEDIICS